MRIPGPPRRPITLSDSLAELDSGVIDATTFSQRLMFTRLFIAAPTKAGYLSQRINSRDVVAVFSCSTDVAEHTGIPQWFSTIGSDLFWLLAPDVVVVLDPSGRHARLVDLAVATGEFVPIAVG